MMDYKIGSHDTMTYLPVKQWYLKPFHFTARCQSKSFDKQIEAGAKLIDIRVWFDNQGTPWFAHGPMRFKGLHPTDVFDWIADYAIEHKLTNSKNKIRCRVILEMNHKLKNQVFQEEKFVEFCKESERMYNKFIYFFGGQRKYDWKKIYDFGTKEADLDDKYSSTTSMFHPTGCNWLDILLAKVDDLWPWLYARLYNTKNLEEGTEKDFLFIDFIGERWTPIELKK